MLCVCVSRPDFLQADRYKHLQPKIWPKIMHHPSTTPILTFISTFYFSTLICIFLSQALHIRK